MTLPGGALVLVATNDRSFAAQLGEELLRLRCEVVAVSSTIDAIAELHGVEFDLAFVADELPPRTGEDVVRVARELSPDTEVVVVLPRGREDAPVRYVRQGAFDFLHQPLVEDELRSVVERALERRQTRTSNAMFRASHAILAGTKPDQLRRVIVELAADVVGADGVAFYTVVGGELEAAERHGFSGREAGVDELAALVGRVQSSTIPLLLPEDSAVGGDLLAGTHVRSALAVPIRIEGQLAGVLAASRTTDPRPFRRGDAERLGVFASQLRLAIENARLVEKTVATERLAAVGELAAGVAHEIASPLTYILGNAISAYEEIRRPRCDVEELCVMLGDIKDGAERLRDIARDLRTLSRGSAVTETFDVGDAIRSALRIAGSSVRGALEIGTTIAGPAPVCGSPGRVSQVFINLLVNAAQAAKTTGGKVKLDLDVKTDGDVVIATVRDEGPGMTPAVLARIFDPFFTTKGSDCGTGLGLAITRSIVQEHGGSIDVASELGRGATFVVRLPTAPRHAAQISAA